MYKRNANHYALYIFNTVQSKMFQNVTIPKWNSFSVWDIMSIKSWMRLVNWAIMKLKH